MKVGPSANHLRPVLFEGCQALFDCCAGAKRLDHPRSHSFSFDLSWRSCPSKREAMGLASESAGELDRTTETFVLRMATTRGQDPERHSTTSEKYGRRSPNLQRRRACPLAKTNCSSFGGGGGGCDVRMWEGES